MRIKEAAKRFKEFTGHEVEYKDSVKMPEHDVSFLIGECDGILYTTVRDGKTEHYIHKFKKRARPLLASSHDGKQLYLLKGKYRFTDRGIIDQ